MSVIKVYFSSYDKIFLSDFELVHFQVDSVPMLRRGKAAKLFN